MNNNKQIWYLIKFFKEKNHSEQFMDGNLYMNRLSFFKEDKNIYNDGRSDKYEATSHWWQPDDLIIKLNFPDLGKLEITNKDLAAPVSMGFNKYNDLHLFCMYAMATEGFECIDGKIDYAKEDSKKLMEQLKIDERCFDFGEYAVIVPAVQFIEKTSLALIKNNKKSTMKSVEYFDGKTFHGSIKKSEIPFHKLKEYSYQNEFRVCIDNGTKGNDHFILKIGNIRDFSKLVKSSELNKLFNIYSIEI